MPAPKTTLATLRPELAGSMEDFDLAMDREGFIGLRVLPVFEAPEQAGSFGRIPLAQLLQNPETLRNSRGGYNRGDWEFDDDTYATKEHGFEEKVDDRDARMYRNYFDAEQIATARALDAVLRGQERRTAAMIWSTATWTGASLTTAVGTPWTLAAKATCTPIDDVETAVRKVWTGTGLWPNALIMGRHTFRNLRNATQIIDRITSSGAGNPVKPSDITAQMLALVFDLPYIIVAKSAKNSAMEGQDASIAPIWSNDYAMVARVAETNDIREPCLGRTLHWGADGSQIGGLIETYRDEAVRADIVRVRHETHEKVFYKELAHLLTNVNNGQAA